jgi:lipopolysaccharide/colanic/teichoic acid biosynthesis glycosyltransferase
MWFNKTKRIIDVVLAIILLIIFSPLLIIVALVIKITSPGPIFADTPKRIGKGGKLFYAYKFRSMIQNAHELQYKDPKYKKVLKEKLEGGNYKPKDDPRITPIGKLIRRHSVDEIPQLINVIRGEMSVVGPRPYYPDELEHQMKKFPGTEKYVKEMLRVKPGITGFWQVTGRSDVKFDKRIEMDAYYARKKSLILDILILLKTPWVMISGKGAW